MAARVAEGSVLKRRVETLEAANAAQAEALREAATSLEQERDVHEARLLEHASAATPPPSRETPKLRETLKRRTSDFSKTMKELFDISEHIHAELQSSKTPRGEKTPNTSSPKTFFFLTGTPAGRTTTRAWND